MFSVACKCEKPLPYELMPFKCHNCKGEIKKSEKKFYCVDNYKSNGTVKRCRNQCTGCWKYEDLNKQ